MAITGIDTIDGKQIIAAGAVSAKSAEMAYNDENGNPITGYLTAVPEGYATTGDLTAYQTTAGMTAYQSAGDYLSANALDDVSGDWNRISALSGYSANGWSISPTAGKKVFANKVLFSPQAGQTITAYLGVYSHGASTADDVYTYITDGSIYFYNRNRSNSAQFIRPDTIVKWNNYASGKLNTTATANFYTTANESGFISEVPAGTMNESAFEYDSNDKISGYNGSAIGGSAPTYDYTDNGLISAIDTSGLYATSGSANHLNQGGTMGGSILQTSGSNSFYYMPLFSPWTTADVATGIFAPLQYTTGACLGMQSNDFRAYFKGNEWFVSNRGIGQALRGEVHASRGVHISGATTAGYGFNLGIKNVSGINATGFWKYGHDEDAALRAVSSCDMHESAFEYDASNNITAYNGSAFAGGGGEFPQSATESIETVTANSADWNGTTDTVSSNSGAWGGSALPISAGPGIKFEMVNDTLVASVDETVLYSGYENIGNDGVATYNLSELPTNFNKIKIYWCLRNNTQLEQGNKGVGSVEYDTNLYSADHTYIAGFMEGASDNTAFQPYRYDANIANIRTTAWTQNGQLTRLTDNTILTNNAQWFHIYKVVGINRIAGGN